jgi:hypothetical protein
MGSFELVCPIAPVKSRPCSTSIGKRAGLVLAGPVAATVQSHEAPPSKDMEHDEIVATYLWRVLAASGLS